MTKSSHTFLGVAALGCLASLIGAPSLIGVIHSSGDFRLDGLSIRGNGTVFEGSLIETSRSRSEVQLTGGSRVTLTPDSRARIYSNRTVLERGTSVIRDTGTRVVEVEALRISQASTGSIVQVALNEPGQVVVGVLSGSADVRTGSGLLVGHVLSGMTLAFEPQGASLGVNLTGRLEKRDGKFFLTDETTHVTMELRGPDLDKYVGKKVKVAGAIISGTAAAAGAAEVASVTSISLATAAAAGGISVGATAAIVGGVAAGATMGGLAAAGTFSSTPVSVP